MKRVYSFATSIGSATCELPDGRRVTLPIVPGILKHPAPGSLAALLSNPDVARKYTQEALRHASWPVLSLFPRAWLEESLREVRVPESRRRALLYLLAE